MLTPPGYCFEDRRDFHGRILVLGEEADDKQVPIAPLADRAW